MKLDVDGQVRKMLFFFFFEEQDNFFFFGNKKDSIKWKRNISSNFVVKKCLIPCQVFSILFTCIILV